jgi:hypothetical protein
LRTANRSRKRRDDMENKPKYATGYIIDDEISEKLDLGSYRLAERMRKNSLSVKEAHEKLKKFSGYKPPIDEDDYETEVFELPKYHLRQAFFDDYLREIENEAARKAQQVINRVIEKTGCKDNQIDFEVLIEEKNGEKPRLKIRAKKSFIDYEVYWYNTTLKKHTAARGILSAIKTGLIYPRKRSKGDVQD